MSAELWRPIRNTRIRTEAVRNEPEVRHARNRDACVGGSQIAKGLSRDNLLRESVTVHDSTTARGAQSHTDQLVASAATDTQQCDQRCRKWNGFTTFHRHRCKVAGRNMFCKAEWKTSSDMWNLEMSDLETNEYATLAQLMNDGASMESMVLNDPVDAVVASAIPQSLSDSDLCTSSELSAAAFADVDDYATLGYMSDGRSRPLTEADLRLTTQTEAIKNFTTRLTHPCRHKIHRPAIGDMSCAAPLAIADSEDVSKIDKCDVPSAESRSGLEPKPAGAPDHDATRKAMIADLHTKRRCQQVGACRKTIGHTAYRRFVRYRDTVTQLLRSWNTKGHIRTTELALKLISIDGFLPASVATPIVSHIFWVGFASASPIFQTWLDMDFGPTPCRPALPFTVLPKALSPITSDLPSSTDYPNDGVGRLAQHKSLAMLNRLARCTRFRYTVRRLDYDPCVLSDPSAPFGALNVVGSDLPVDLPFMPLPTHRAPAPPGGGESRRPRCTCQWPWWSRSWPWTCWRSWRWLSWRCTNPCVSC